ncbi:hypothetical protein AAMO2058_000555600 [Amorphochlora amoebiformis]
MYPVLGYANGGVSRGVLGLGRQRNIFRAWFGTQPFRSFKYIRPKASVGHHSCNSTSRRSLSGESSPASAGKLQRNILVCIDGSDHSDYALNWSLSNLITPYDKVNILTCCEKKTLPRDSLGIDTVANEQVEGLESEMDVAALKEGEELVQERINLCTENGIKASPIVKLGHATHIICEYAEDEKVDVVVVSSKGRTALGRILLGSVSTYCVKHCKSPVLLVKKPQTKESL